jgi:hypothetical protein
MQQCVDDIYDRSQQEQLPVLSDAAIDMQLTRVAQEIVPASHFFDKSTMMGVLSLTLMSAAPEINDWLQGPLLDDSRFMLRLRVDVDEFIGKGIYLDGNERATTTSTLVLTRAPSYVDGTKMPFSIKTMYPDITVNHDVGMLVTTGRNCGAGLLPKINAAPKINQMYWRLRSVGESAQITQATPPSVRLYGTADNIQYSAFYNHQSYSNGLIMVYDTQKQEFLPLRKSSYSDIEKSHIMQDENTRGAKHWRDLSDGCHLALTRSDVLFPPCREELLRDSARSLDVEVLPGGN